MDFSPRCDLNIGAVKIKQVDEFNNLRNVSTNHGKCDTKLRRQIEISKYATLESKLKNENFIGNKE